MAGGAREVDDPAWVVDKPPPINGYKLLQPSYNMPWQPGRQRQGISAAPSVW
jgi:hypothetical protein